VALASLAAARGGVGSAQAAVPGFHSLWDRWDVGLFTKVARYGYLSPSYKDRTEVDFPGMPIAMRLVHLIARDWIWSGLIVSFIAGALACASLWRLSADEVGEHRARAAVLGLVLFPYAVFVFAAYSEALVFSAPLRPRGSPPGGSVWWLAGLAGAVSRPAPASRVSRWAWRWPSSTSCSRRRAGLPIVRPRPCWRSRCRRCPSSASSPTCTTGPATGTPTRSPCARAGTRTIDWPWEGWKATWRGAFDTTQDAAFLLVLARRVCWRSVVGVVLTVVLARGRRWGEGRLRRGQHAADERLVLLRLGDTHGAGVVPAVPCARARCGQATMGAAHVTSGRPRRFMAVFVVAFTQGHWVD